MHEPNPDGRQRVGLRFTAFRSSTGIAAIWRVGLVILSFCSLGAHDRVAAQGTNEKPPASPEADMREIYVRSVEAYRRGEYVESADLARRALAMAEAIFGPHHPATYHSAFSLAASLQAQRLWTEAEPLLIRVIEGLERLEGDNVELQIRSINNLGTLYRHQGRYREAEPLLVRAMETNERLFGSDHRDTVRLTGTLVELYEAQGRYADGEPLLRRMISSSERLSGANHVDTLSAIARLAHVYVNSGRFSEAEQMSLRALEGFEVSLGPKHGATLTALSLLGQVLTYQGRYSEAELILLRALERSDDAQSPNHALSAYAASGLGYHYEFRGRHEEAERYNAMAVSAYRRLNGIDHPNTLAATLNLAETYGSLNRHQDAAQLLQQALTASEGSPRPNRPLILAIVNELGDISRARRSWPEAEQHYRRAFEGRQHDLGEAHPDTIESALGMAITRLEARGALGSATEPARAAISAMRARRGAAAGRDVDAAEVSSRSYRPGDFAVLADALWQESSSLPAGIDAANEAFLALQDAMAGTADRAVMQMAVRHLAEDAQPGLGALLRDRDLLGDQLASNRRNYRESFAETDGEAADLRRRLLADRTQLETRIDGIDATLRNRFPDYFALIRPEGLDVAATQRLLADDEAILLVAPTPFGTHVVAVNRNGLTWHRSDWTETRVSTAVARLQHDIATTMSGEGFSYDRGTAHSLYRELVAPVAAALGETRHVFVAAGGALATLPFGTFVVEQPNGADDDPEALRTTRWFADSHALTQIPSVQSLQFLRRRGPAARATGGRQTFVGFGDPVLMGQSVVRGRGQTSGRESIASLFSGQRTRSGVSLADIGQLRRLSRLPGTAAELESIRNALAAPPESLFLAERATERNFRSMDLAGTHVVVLATHGLVAGELRGFQEPGLVFTPPQASSEEDDGFLTASEVSALRLGADWVILSACNTAAGDGSAGASELSGLARAFFYAGARNLLASHWPVADEAAPRLTVRTIELMRENPSLSRAEALQRSMREVREDRTNAAWSHPGVWGPFTLIGDGAN